MKKSTVIIVIILLLILLGGGLFYFMSKTHKSATQSPENATSQNQTQESTQKKSLFDFFSMTGSLKCTFSDKTKSSSGTVYVSTGKMRGDFQSVEEGTTHQTHMINDGQFVYMWTDGQKTGYKMSLATMKNQASKFHMPTAKGSSEGSSSSQGPDMHEQTNYSCGPLVSNASLFSVPTDVTFTDYSAMMQGAMKGMNMHPSAATQSNQAACAQCDQAPAGAARTQCRAALKCQ